MKPTNYFRYLNCCQGFTLVELLIAAAISGAVITLGGYGLMSVMKADKTTSAQSERRIEQNRALEFISSEVKAATKIEKDAATAANALVTAGSLSLPTGAQPVLVLDVPIAGSTTQKIVYYLAPPPNTTPPSVWQGPNLLYRFGPGFNTDGSYNTAAAASSQVLIDLISDTTTAGQACSDSTWSVNPSSNRKGFYACINPDGKVAEIYEIGRVQKALQVNDTYRISSRVYARNTPPGTAINANTPAFTLSGGVLTIPSTAKLTFQRLGGSITCGSPGPTIPVTTKLYFNGNTNSSTATTLDPVTPLTRLPGTTTSVVVESIAKGNSSSGNCSSFNFSMKSDTGSSNVIALRNGDRAPNYVPYGNQAKIDDYLKPVLDPVTGKVNIGANQVIYLFELGTTNTTSAAFDMQDNVVLATIDGS